MKKITGLERGVLLLTLLFVLFTVGWFVADNRHDSPVQVESTGGQQMPPPVIEEPAPGILDGERIDINSAIAADLTRLPGIGQVKAEAIVQYREENGAFVVKEDLMNVSGIGEKTFANLEAYITVEGVGEHAADTGGG